MGESCLLQFVGLVFALPRPLLKMLHTLVKNTHSSSIALPRQSALRAKQNTIREGEIERRLVRKRIRGIIV